MSKKFTKYPIKAAQDDVEDTRLEDIIDTLEDDFDYILSGLSMLDRTGGGNREAGIAIAQDLSDKLQEVIQNIGRTVGRSEE